MVCKSVLLKEAAIRLIWVPSHNPLLTPQNTQGQDSGQGHTCGLDRSPNLLELLPSGQGIMQLYLCVCVCVCVLNKKPNELLPSSQRSLCGGGSEGTGVAGKTTAPSKWTGTYGFPSQATVMYFCFWLVL